MSLYYRRINLVLVAFLGLLLWLVPSNADSQSIQLSYGSRLQLSILVECVEGGGVERIEPIAINTSVGVRQYIFLPASVNTNNIIVQYLGDNLLYSHNDPNGRSYGETFRCDWSELEQKAEITVDFIEKTPLDLMNYHEYTIMKSKNIPSIFISLAGDIDVLDKIHERKEYNTTGTFRMIDPFGKMICNDEIEIFKGHGNSSFVQPGISEEKKSYGIKLKKKAELIKGCGKTKKWTLLHIRVSASNTFDYTGLSTVFGLQSFRELADGEYYTSEAKYVDLFIEGDYRGTYLLTKRMTNKSAISVEETDDYVTCENIENTITVSDLADRTIQMGVREYTYINGAYPITAKFNETGGFVLEVDCHQYEGCGFITKHGVPIRIKCPKVCTKEQVKYIAEYTQGFEDAIFSPTGYNDKKKHYSEYCNLRSMVDLVLSYAFFENWELFRTSTYMYKNVEGEQHDKLTFGPVWDFETGYTILRDDHSFFGFHNTYEDEQQYIWLEQLWKKSEFKALLLFENKKMIDFIESILYGSENIDTISRVSKLVDSSYRMNWARWNYSDFLDSEDRDYRYCFEKYKEAIQQRLETWKALTDPSHFLYGASVKKIESPEGDRLMIVCECQQISGYQWYTIEDNQISILEDEISKDLLIQGENASFSYLCLIKGLNSAYHPNANGEYFSNELIDEYVCYFPE